MRAVLQRVSRAEVTEAGVSLASIGAGMLVLVAIAREDTLADLEWMARKITELRIFDDADGKLNLSLLETRGELLIVSQFTLYGECRKGRRPSYSDAAPPADAEKMYREFVQFVRRLVPEAKTGRFQAMMDVALVNAGPVTLIVESPRPPRSAW